MPFHDIYIQMMVQVFKTMTDSHSWKKYDLDVCFFLIADDVSDDMTCQILGYNPIAIGAMKPFGNHIKLALYWLVGI